jgi:hypothetical protein
MMQFGPEWAIWTWLVIVAVSIVAAVVVRLSFRRTLAALAPHHVAAAAVVGVITWSLLTLLPNTIQTVMATYAGIVSAPNQGLHQAFAAGQVAAIVAGVLAVLGLLRRAAWAVALAAGVCLASIGTSAIALINWIGLIGDMEAVPGSEWIVVQFALQPAPAVAGLLLLAWPFVDGSLGPTRFGVTDRRAAGTVEGIVDADSEEAVGVEWPDWSPPASDQR